MNNILLKDQQTLQPSLNGYRIYDSGRRPILSLLDQFSPIYLDQLGKAALMDRQETKYVFRRGQILRLLPELMADYHVLEIEGLRICNYWTEYYDTNEFLFFQQHHKGAGQRWKIRQRTYLDSHINFLEVKYKDNRKRTKKSRIQTDINQNQMLEKGGTFLSSNFPFSLAELHPTLEVLYIRTTLVKKDCLERITLDSQLHFSNGIISQELEGLMIAEVKQAGYNPKSPFMSQLKTNGIRPSPFSKYCIGISLLYPEIKHNRFKPTLLQVHNMLEGGFIHERTH